MEARRNPYRYDPSYYVQGSAVRKLNRSSAAPAEPLVREPVRKSPERKSYPAGRPVREPARREHTQRKEVQEQERGIISLGRGINFFGILLLAAALFVTVFVCIDYLQLQEESLRLDRAVAALQDELSLLIDANNAKENLMTADIDLERIYQTAVGELGMVFPNHNEIVYYNSVDLSYVRQYADIPAVANSILDKLIP